MTEQPTTDRTVTMLSDSNTTLHFTALDDRSDYQTLIDAGAFAGRLGNTRPELVTATGFGPVFPRWEAVYDSATFTPYLIGYCNDEEPAKAAALAWFRANCDTSDRLVWEPDLQMTGQEWDQWFTLGRYNADATALATDIVVRHRREA